ncbi:TPA: response regulator transcription factor [Burkholderia territorii]|uniref:winged helix-turn-helix domain-containing protein n=1 Tax=Burkholderia territorii TaxID=1503055 RepID=UPI0011C79B73|nr:response regulator transcription factor [Burkholderia territorii]TXG23470.1 response regulator transcription factor [Burkholderia territorii]HDR8861584.1 response regulator transcription factor [Burkholderia territorii]HDR8867266.1 response regulator transcription factor [Burkholderia territorii]HDR8873618.1 response regulator transcription factor [Burkholderia territorii]HDR8879825.1 response regulator transcription factor [Burkholderia territorii]
MTTRVLVVEPDPRVRDMMRALLRGCQIDSSALDDVSLLLAHVTEAPPTLIVLRVERPATAFHMALGALRRAGHDMPVIVISRDAQVVDKVVALELGADDYVVEPFEPMELVARVRSAMRRYAANRAEPVRAGGKPESYAFGDIEVNFVSRRATRAGYDLGLRASEFALLELFISQPMCVLSRAEILALLGLNVAGRSERGLDVLIFRLRNLIERAVGDYRYIRTVRGKGYIFVPLGTLADDDADLPPHA